MQAELPASASMWHASLPEVVTQRSVNAAAQAAATAPVAHKLVDSLQAQSLDLPPQAAKVGMSDSMLGGAPVAKAWLRRQRACCRRRHWTCHPRQSKVRAPFLPGGSTAKHTSWRRMQASQERQGTTCTERLPVNMPCTCRLQRAVLDGAVHPVAAPAGVQLKQVVVHVTCDESASSAQLLTACLCNDVNSSDSGQFALRIKSTAISVLVPMQWRQQVRGPPSQQLIVTEASEEDAEPEEREGLPAGLRSLLKGRKPDRVDVRERTTGILLSDRSDSWDQQDL